MANKIQARKRARVLVMQCLYEWTMSDNSVNDTMANALLNNKAAIDTEYFKETLLAIHQGHQELDAALAPYLNRDIAELDPIALAILRLGAFELMHRLDIPYKVVINEALENAKRFGAQDSHRFVNGVLDKLAIEHRSIELKAK